MFQLILLYRREKYLDMHQKPLYSHQLIRWKHIIVFNEWFKPRFRANNDIRGVRVNKIKERFFFHCQFKTSTNNELFKIVSEKSLGS